MSAKVIVIGASSAIAKAVIDKHLDTMPSSSDSPYLIAVSRNKQDIASPHALDLVCDYSESQIEAVSRDINQEVDKPTHIYIFNGVLHCDDFMPEKRLQNLNAEQLTAQFNSNAIVPMLWIKHLLPVLKQGQHCIVTVLSARVGSLTDNQLGGWYSYRSSKAALNMMLKNASIELVRVAPKVKLLSFHPGTTDTPLSKPFQKNVAEDKLFEPEFVANALFNVQSNLAYDGELSYRDWNDQAIDW